MLNLMNPFFRSNTYQLSSKRLAKLVGTPLRKVDSQDIEGKLSLSLSVNTQSVTRRRSRSDFSLIQSVNEDYEDYLAMNIHERFVIPADHRLKFIFDVCISLTIVYSVTTSLFYLAFTEQSQSDINTDRVVWALFIIDLFVRFFTEIVDETGKKIKNLNLIAKHYAKGWLLPDLASLIPLSWAGHPNSEYILRLIRIAKLRRIFQIVNIDRISVSFSNFLHPNSSRQQNIDKILVCHFWELFQALTEMMFASYCIACLWWYYSQFIYRRQNEENDFVRYYGLDKDSYMTQAIKTWYFIFSTMMTVGYGDFTATNKYEMGFSILILVIGPSWFAFSIGKVLAIVRRLEEVGGNEDRRGSLAIWISNLESKFRPMPVALKGKINKHYLNFWRNDRLGSLANIALETFTIYQLREVQDPYLNALPDKVKIEIFEHLFNDFFTNFRHFLGRSSGWRYSLCLYLQPRIYEKGDSIIEVNKTVNELNFLFTGKVLVGFMNCGVFHQLFYKDTTYIIGDYFVFNDVPSFLQVKADTIVHCYSVPSFIMKRIVRQNDESLMKYFRVLGRNYQKIRNRIERELESIKEVPEATRKSLAPLVDKDRETPDIELIKPSLVGDKELANLNRVVYNMRENRSRTMRSIKEKLIQVIYKLEARTSDPETSRKNYFPS